METQNSPSWWKSLWPPAYATIAYIIGLLTTCGALGCLYNPVKGLLVFGLGCIGVTAAGRLGLAGVALLAATAFGAWKLAACIFANPNLHPPQAAVLVVIIIGWCSLTIAALLFLSRRDDTWR
ncbi:MAG: hypothetical protein WCT12_15595 [Verrucomicrobiota bacterium]